MSPTAAIPSDPAPAGAPVAAPDAGRTAFDQEQDSYRRAMPIQRLLGGGMRHADAVALNAMGDAGIAWVDGGEWLGERNLRLAGVAASLPSARACFRFASACFRFAQVVVPTDDARKRSLLTRMIDAFAAAGALDDPAVEKHEIPWMKGKLCGWLMRPAELTDAPTVIVFGGFDGWREEYHSGAVALVERGVAAFLVDGPGQGEARLMHRLYLDPGFPDAFATVASYLRALPGLSQRVGIWGNSLGGFLAAQSVATTGAFDALCVNGGTILPRELPDRFPRFQVKVEAMAGSAERAVAIMREFDLSPTVASITCPLLQLHGAPDQVFLLENARRIHDGAESADKTLKVWDDGDHCLYNHGDDKNMIVADWFAQRLGARQGDDRWQHGRVT